MVLILHIWDRLHQKLCRKIVILDYLYLSVPLLQGSTKKCFHTKYLENTMVYAQNSWIYSHIVTFKVDFLSGKWNVKITNLNQRAIYLCEIYTV